MCIRDSFSYADIKFRIKARYTNGNLPDLVPEPEYFSHYIINDKRHDFFTLKDVSTDVEKVQRIALILQDPISNERYEILETLEVERGGENEITIYMPTQKILAQLNLPGEQRIGPNEQVKWQIAGGGVVEEVTTSEPALEFYALPMTYTITASTTNGQGEHSFSVSGNTTDERLVILELGSTSPSPTANPSAIVALDIAYSAKAINIGPGSVMVCFESDSTFESIFVSDKGAELPLSPGRYNIILKEIVVPNQPCLPTGDHGLTLGTVTLQPEQRLELNGKLGAGTVAIEIEGNSKDDVLWTLTQNSTDENLKFTGPTFLQTLHPGAYTLRASLGEAVYNTEFQVPLTGGKINQTLN